MASTYYEDRHGRPQLLHIDASAPYVNGPSGLSGGGGGLTDPLTWANQFRRNDSQITQAQLPGAAPTSAAAPISPIHSVMNEIYSHPSFADLGGVSAAGNTPTPSLTKFAQNGSGNHAQSWMETAQQGAQRVAPYMQQGSTAQTTYGNTGLRKPYIGGAQGDMTNQFADRGDASLDQNYINRKYNNGFSFASAFR